jgi:polyisoprenyl-phosphate glycosyltransferase
MKAEETAPLRLAVLIPVYDDWESLNRLLDELAAHLHAGGLAADVLLVDDGSPSAPDIVIPTAGRDALRSVSVLPLTRNVGHQRAIALGLAWVRDHLPCEAVVVMDADGEDKPEDVGRLVKAFEEEGRSRIVFARRDRRSESWVFQAGYRVYQALSLVSTGKSARVGNFSILPAACLDALVTVSELWNHYAAAVHATRLPWTTLPTHRGRRYAGRSRMNLPAWVAHGMGAMSVLAPIVAARLLLAQSTLLAIGLLLAGVFLARGPAAAWPSVALFLLLAAQGSLLLFALLILMLSGRDKFAFLPVRDYAFFVKPVVRIHPDA